MNTVQRGPDMVNSATVPGHCVDSRDASPDAEWIMVSRKEYRRLQYMQGLLLLILLGIAGIVPG